MSEEGHDVGSDCEILCWPQGRCVCVRGVVPAPTLPGLAPCDDNKLALAGAQCVPPFNLAGHPSLKRGVSTSAVSNESDQERLAATNGRAQG